MSTCAGTYEDMAALGVERYLLGSHGRNRSGKYEGREGVNPQKKSRGRKVRGKVPPPTLPPNPIDVEK